MYNYRDTMATKCNPFSESRRTVSIKRKKKRKLHQETKKQNILQGIKYIKKKFLKQEEYRTQASKNKIE